MASPQTKNGYTKIANEIMDALCRFRIPGEIRLVIDCVIRKTYGYNKREDVIAHKQIMEMTGMDKGNLSRSLLKAIKHKLVIRSDNKLSFNKNYEEWISFSTPVVRSDNKKTVVRSDNVVVKADSKVVRSDNDLLSEVTDTKDNKDNIQKKEDKHSRECFVPSAKVSDSKQKITFNFLTYQWENIKEEDKTLWKEAYPACNIDIELKKMADWIISNKDKGKKKRYRRFISNWLSRSQDRGGTKGVEEEDKWLKKYKDKED